MSWCTTGAALQMNYSCLQLEKGAGKRVKSKKNERQRTGDVNRMINMCEYKLLTA